MRYVDRKKSELLRGGAARTNATTFSVFNISAIHLADLLGYDGEVTELELAQLATKDTTGPDSLLDPKVFTVTVKHRTVSK